MKKPWLAAFLNLAFFGGGYIYNGKQKMLGAGLVLGCVLVRFGEIPIYITHLVDEKWLVLFIGLVVIQITLATDAYREAKKLNVQHLNK